MKIYHFGRGKTIAWFCDLKRKQDERPVIIFTKSKIAAPLDMLGKSAPGRKLTFMERLTSTWFVFRDVDALRFWLESMLAYINKRYPKD